MKRLMILAVCTGMVWGCGKSATITGPGGGTESLEVVSAVTLVSGHITTVTPQVRFNAKDGRACYVDSFLVTFPDTNGTLLNCLKDIFAGRGEGTLVNGGTTVDLGAWAITGAPNEACYPANIAGHGNYKVVAWGTWDGVVHQSAVYSWTW